MVTVIPAPVRQRSGFSEPRQSRVGVDPNQNKSSKFGAQTCPPEMAADGQPERDCLDLCDLHAARSAGWQVASGAFSSNASRRFHAAREPGLRGEGSMASSPYSGRAVHCPDARVRARHTAGTHRPQGTCAVQMCFVKYRCTRPNATGPLGAAVPIDQDLLPLWDTTDAASAFEPADWFAYCSRVNGRHVPAVPVLAVQSVINEPLADIHLRLVEDRVLGGLDACVLNADIFLCAGSILDETAPDHDQVMQVNERGVWLGIRGVARSLASAGGRPGRIVCIASISGLVGLPREPAYCASKAAVVNLTRAAARDLAPHEITVNAICAGFIAMAMLREELTDPDRWAALEAATPWPRLGTVEDVAAAASFLVPTTLPGSPERCSRSMAATPASERASGELRDSS
jgi:NAD(P)-dependent dehydrogenase (short-subunit alcohol dehydrogenase family)